MVGSNRSAGGVRLDGTVRHSGGKAGYRSGFAFNPNSGIGAIVLANARTDDLPIDLAQYLVTGEQLGPVPAPRATKQRLELSAEELGEFEGLYEADEGRRWEVAAAQGILRIRYPGSSILEFVASGPDEFFYNAGNDGHRLCAGRPGADRRFDRVRRRQGRGSG